MLKVYQSINAVYFSTDIMLGEKKSIRIAFDNGVRYPKKNNGTYITDNTEIQKAIEADASFNVEFKLIRSEGKAEEKEKEEDSTGDKNVKDYPEVTTVGVARKILKNVFERDAKNRVEVLAISEELGLTFPNLPTE